MRLGRREGFRKQLGRGQFNPSFLLKSSFDQGTATKRNFNLQRSLQEDDQIGKSEEKVKQLLEQL